MHISNGTLSISTSSGLKFSSLFEFLVMLASTALCFLDKCLFMFRFALKTSIHSGHLTFSWSCWCFLCCWWLRKDLGFFHMHQQSTSKGLVFHQFYAFFFCDLSCMLSNWFCTCTLENLCRKVHDSLLGSMHGCANVEAADLWSEKAFHSLDRQSVFQFASDGQFSCVVSRKLLPCLYYRHHIFLFVLSWL